MGRKVGFVCPSCLSAEMIVLISFFELCRILIVLLSTSDTAYKDQVFDSSIGSVIWF